MSKRVWTEDQKNYIIKSYCEDGKNLEVIGRQFHAKGTTISKYLKEWGVEIKPKGCSLNRRLNHNYFSKIDAPQKAYFLGLLFTDGSIVLDDKRSPSISIELVESDIDILQKFKEELNSDGNFYYNKRDNRTNGTYSFSIRSKQLARDLEKYNIIPNKTYQTSSLVIPYEFKKEFLRGIIDGDGSIYYSNSAWHVNVCGHNDNIIKQVVELGNSLIGVVDQKKIQCSNGVYRYSWNGKQAIQLCKILYGENTIFAIKRKQEKALKATASNIS